MDKSSPVCETGLRILLRSISETVISDPDITTQDSVYRCYDNEIEPSTSGKRVVIRSGDVIGIFSRIRCRRLDLLLRMIVSTVLPRTYYGTDGFGSKQGVYGRISLCGKGSHVHIFDCSYRFPLEALQKFLREYITDRASSAIVSGHIRVSSEKQFMKLIDSIYEDSVSRVKLYFTHNILELTLGLVFLSSEASRDISGLCPLIILEELSAFQYMNSLEPPNFRVRSATIKRPFSDLKLSLSRALDMLKSNCAAGIVIMHSIPPSSRITDTPSSANPDRLYYSPLSQKVFSSIITL